MIINTGKEDPNVIFVWSHLDCDKMNRAVLYFLFNP